MCFCKADAQVLGPPVQSCVGFVGRMPRFLVGRPIFYKQVCHGASVLDILGHPWASVFRNVGFEGHPFSQKGHPLTRNVGFGGHQARPVALFKIKKMRNKISIKFSISKLKIVLAENISLLAGLLVFIVTK